MMTVAEFNDFLNAMLSEAIIDNDTEAVEVFTTAITRWNSLNVNLYPLDAYRFFFLITRDNLASPTVSRKKRHAFRDMMDVIDGMNLDFTRC